MKARKYECEQVPEIDRELFIKMKTDSITKNESIFFKKMEYKELYEYPKTISDMILYNGDNSEGIYITKLNCSNYEIGIVTELVTGCIKNTPASLSEALDTDLFPLLNKHITLLEWFRQRDYKGLNYNYKWI